MIKKFSELFRRLEFKKENLIPFLIFIGITIAVFVVGVTFNIKITTVALTIIFILFSFLTLFTWLMAGLAVFRALFVVGAGLSLVIFIGQSFCDVPVKFHTADSSLMNIIGFGLLYVGGLFIVSLYKELYGDKEAKSDSRQKGMIKLFKDMNGGKNPWLILVLYALFLGLFLWQLYQVINPIIDNLCVYSGK